MVVSALRKRVSISVTLLLALALAQVAIPTHASSPNHLSVPMECHEYYFFEIIRVSHGSSAVSGVRLDVPINASLGNIVQRSWIVLAVNVSRGWVANVSTPGVRYIVARVVVCYPNSTWMIRLVRAFLSIPNLYRNESVPTKILREYVGKPEPIIVNVSRAFTSWLRKEGVPFYELSVGGLAYRAALFIYWVYITYVPSAIPHSVTETVKSRRGDCDDMSRVLTELLWFYRVPALMVYGFVVLNLTKPLAGSLGKLTFVLPNAGPHAFVVAYVPPFGWLSVDLLAGSYIAYPFIIVEITNDTRVSESEVSKFVETCLTLNATEIAFVVPASRVNEVAKALWVPVEYVLSRVASFAATYGNPANLSISAITEFLDRMYVEGVNAVLALLRSFGVASLGSLGVAKWRFGSLVDLPR